jgi:ABC-type multidrug transport system fused ATPase/permease subunit
MLVLGAAAIGQAAAQTGGWLLVRAAIDSGIQTGDKQFLAEMVVVYLIVAAAGWVLSAYTIRGLAQLGQGVVLGLRRDLFDHLTSLSLRYFSEQRAGWIIARLTSDVDALSDVLSQGLPTLVANLVLLPTAAIAVFIVDWRLGLIAFVILPPTYILTRWFQRQASAAQLDVRNRIAAVTAHLAESVSGMAIVQAFNAEARFQATFDELNMENRTANVRTQTLFSVFFPSIELLGMISTCCVLALGSRLYAHGSLTIGTLITAAYLLQLVFQPLQELSDVYGQLQAAAAAMIKIGSVLDADPDIADDPAATPIPPIDGTLQLDDVRFSYGSNEVIHGIDFRVEPGGCIALVGQSGGGKSTLAKLIARFYDPSYGAVRVDGHDLRGVRLRSYRRQLGVVLQDPFLFAGTIADNIRFAARRHRRAGRRDCGSRRRRPRRCAAERRARPRCPRRRRRAVGGGAAADLDRTRAPRRSADPDPRRGDVEHRPANRDPDRGRARPPAARPHVGDHRAPPGHRPAGRRGARRRARESDAARPGARADRRGRPLPAARARARDRMTPA